MADMQCSFAVSAVIAACGGRQDEGAAVSVVIITLTGIFMLNGPKGILGRGGIEFVVGLLFPLAFILLL